MGGEPTHFTKELLGSRRLEGAGRALGGAGQPCDACLLGGGAPRGSACFLLCSDNCCTPPRLLAGQST